jgi:hypothetical protein
MCRIGRFLSKVLAKQDILVSYVEVGATEMDFLECGVPYLGDAGIYSNLRSESTEYRAFERSACSYMRLSRANASDNAASWKRKRDAGRGQSERRRPVLIKSRQEPARLGSRIVKLFSRKNVFGPWLMRIAFRRIIDHPSARAEEERYRLLEERRHKVAEKGH